MLLKIALVFFVGAAGFMIYGATLPNNPPDLIAGGIIAAVGFVACFAIGIAFWLVWIMKQFAQKGGHDS